MPLKNFFRSANEEIDEELPYLDKGTAYTFTPGDLKKRQGNPIGFIWDQSPNHISGDKPGFGFTGAENFTSRAAPYGRAPSFTEILSYKLHFIGDTLEDWTSVSPLTDKVVKMTMVAAGLAAAIMFKPQLQDFGRDVDGPSDLIDKIGLMLPKPLGLKFSRRQDFHFNRNDITLNSQEIDRLFLAARYLNDHPDTEATITAYGKDILSRKRVEKIDSMLKNFGVDPERAGKGVIFIKPKGDQKDILTVQTEKTAFGPKPQ